MIAFDADVLGQIFAGDPLVSNRAQSIPVHEQRVTIVVVEEILRGRLNSIRQAESGKSRVTIEGAYALFEETLSAFRHLTVLPYTSQAEALYHEWRVQGIRVGTHDLRIAAICVVHGARLVTRNRRDFEQVPGVLLEIWA